MPFGWYRYAMRTTIDQAGRIVIPKSVRDAVGLRPGEVEVVIDGNAIRLEPLEVGDLEEKEGRLVIPAAGAPLTAGDIDALRRADQR